MWVFELDTAAASPPITTAEAKTHLNVDTHDDDTLIDSLVLAATELVQGQTERQLVTATWKLHMDCFPPGNIWIRKATIASITSVTYYDENDSQQTWASSKYHADLVSKPARIRPVWGESYPSTMIGRTNAVTVEFIAGTAVGSVPDAAKHAVKLLVSHWYENREAAEPKSYQNVPFAAQALIDNLKWTDYAAV